MSGDTSEIRFKLDGEDVAAAVILKENAALTEMGIREFASERLAAFKVPRLVVVLDEIPTALGRTGRMFACEHYEAVPDMLVVGKGLGGGIFPLAALIVREGLDVAPDRALGHYTHEKSPVGCAAGLATLEVLEEEDLPGRAAALGARTLERLREMAAADPRIRDVRGIGLLLGVELAADATDGVSSLAETLMYECLARGLSFKISMGRVLTLAPALTIEEDELDRALEILGEALAAVSFIGVHDVHEDVVIRRSDRLLLLLPAGSARPRPHHRLRHHQHHRWARSRGNTMSLPRCWSSRAPSLT